MRLTKSWILLILIAFSLFPGAIFAQVSFIQSKLAPVFDKPSFAGKKIANLTQGKQVEIINSEKSWVNIRFDSQTGWVAKMLLAQSAPLPKTQTENSAPADRQKKARKRASVRASAAATRGFSSEFRQRSEQPRDSNYQDLKKLEQLQIEDKEVREFNQSLPQ